MRHSTLWLLLLFPVATCWGQGKISVRHVVVPAYPVLARMARLEGAIAVEAQVGADGHVISAKAMGGPDLLARAAEKNLQQWRFSAEAPGQNRTSRLTINYLFILKGKEDYYDASSTVTLDLPDRVEVVARPAKLETSSK